MKIAFTSTGDGWDAKVDPRFGRTDYFLIYDDATEAFTLVDNTEIRSVEHGAGPKSAEKIFELAPDVLITGNGPGGNAASILTKTKMKIYVGAGGMSIREAYNAFKNNELQKGV